MPKAHSNAKKPLSGATIKRDSQDGRFVGVIGEADAKRFRSANSALTEMVTSSRAHAVKVLQASGFLTATGKVAKRYK